MRLSASERFSRDALYWRHIRIARPSVAAPGGDHRRIYETLRREAACLVEVYETIDSAIRREKSIKRWHRQWKMQLVEAENPTWRDLAEDFGFESLIKKKVDPGSRPG